MSVGRKLNMAFYAVIALLCISVAISFYNLDKIKEKTEEAFGSVMEQINTIDEMLINTALQGLYARALVIENTDENHDYLLSYAAELDTNILNLKDMVNNDIMDGYWTEINDYNNEFNAIESIS